MQSTEPAEGYVIAWHVVTQARHDQRKPAQGLDALGGPKALLRCLRLLRARPVMPGHADVPMSLLALLQASQYLCSAGRGLLTSLWSLVLLHGVLLVPMLCAFR